MKAISLILESPKNMGVEQMSISISPNMGIEIS
jgi:hypothetical protein